MNKDRCLWFTIGLAIGAAAGLLFAPKSGARTRAMIAAQAKRGQLLLKEQAADVKENVAETLERGREAVRAVVGAGRKTFAG